MQHEEINTPSMGVDRKYRQRIKQSTEAAQRYLQRPRSKHKAEMALVKKAFGIVPPGCRVLDIPCGTGRATILLQQLGYDCTGADIGDGAIEVAKQQVRIAGLESLIEKKDLEAIDYPDGAFDTALCFRLFHHLPTDEVRDKVVSELCRVAKSHVVISYFSPASLTSIKRSLRATFTGTQSRQHATSLEDVEGFFTQQGFSLVKNFARLPFIHTLHLAVFERNPVPAN